MKEEITKLSRIEYIAARFGMMQIVRCRFRAFEAKFHREPRPHEPLFFDESKDSVFPVDPKVAQMQLEKAARASGTELGPVLKLLGLAPTAGRERRGGGSISRQTESCGRLARAKKSSRSVLRQPPPWYADLTDRRLRRRYRISGQELKLLSQVSLLGRPQTVNDCRYILKLIRDAETRSK